MQHTIREDKAIRQENGGKKLCTFLTDFCFKGKES